MVWRPGDGFGVTMACKACKSENLQKLEGELTASLPNLKDVKAPPFYVCATVLACLDCGFAEFHIPTNELQSLKRGKTSSGS